MLARAIHWSAQTEGNQFASRLLDIVDGTHLDEHRVYAPRELPWRLRSRLQRKILNVNECAAEYAEGYNSGFCAGVLNDDRRGNEQGIFVSGYWDGYSEGSLLRTDRFTEVCAG